MADTGKGLLISTIERPGKDWSVKEAARNRASGGPEPSTDIGKQPNEAETAVGNGLSWVRCCMHALLTQCITLPLSVGEQHLL